jgi:hypothetical protein
VGVGRVRFGCATAGVGVRVRRLAVLQGEGAPVSGEREPLLPSSPASNAAIIQGCPTIASLRRTARGVLGGRRTVVRSTRV